MAILTKTSAIYALGICETSLQTIQSYYQTDVEIISPGELTDKTELISAGLLWVALPAWLGLSSEARLELAGAEKILLLPPTTGIKDLEELDDLDFNAIMAEPIDTSAVQKATNKVRAKQNLYKDANRMLKEIFLERELLERKSLNLNFLLQFLTNTYSTLEPDKILTIATQIIDELLPVKNLGAFLWLEGQDKPSACMFIPAERDSTSWKLWESTLLNAAQSIFHNNEQLHYECRSLPHGTEQDTGAGPELSLAIPLCINEIPLGVVVIGLDKDYPLGRDTVEVLESALTHLALALHSAWLYGQVKELTQCDPFAGHEQRQAFI